MNQFQRVVNKLTLFERDNYDILYDSPRWPVLLTMECHMNVMLVMKLVQTFSNIVAAILDIVTSHNVVVPSI